MTAPGSNIILATDSYKQTHWKMYPPGTEYICSYFESRSGSEIPETVFFGLQYLMDEHFSGVVVTQEKIDEAESFCRAHFGQELFNRAGWEHILSAHGGKLPVTIAAVPEGAVIPESNVLLTIRNTDPRCAWLVNHLETLLVQLWYPSTVATISREMKKILLAALQKTGDPGTLPHKLHDFGCRGAAMGSAAIGGAAHLVNFQSTDTIAAIELLRRHYGADMPAVSVPAAEHSTICAWGENGEEDAYRHILQEFPEGIVSVVSDSWDVMDACDRLWGGSLADRDHREAADARGAPG